MDTVIRFAGFSGDDPEIVLRRLGPRRFRLDTVFRYQDPDVGTITVPADPSRFETDLASIPWFTTFIAPTTGEHLPAVLLHDALVGDRTDPTYRTRDGHEISRDAADRIFDDAMKASGTPSVRRLIIWSAVRMSADRVRFLLWGLLVVIVAGVHALDVVDAIDAVPWLGAWPLLVEWPVAAVAITVALAVVGPLVVGFGKTRAAIVQAVVIGLVFLPVLAMLPARAALVWIPEAVFRR